MNKKNQIPTPAHPHKRREALPWQQPKATNVTVAPDRGSDVACG
jgi:hypothetical protein